MMFFDVYIIRTKSWAVLTL